MKQFDGMGSSRDQGCQGSIHKKGRCHKPFGVSRFRNRIDEMFLQLDLFDVMNKKQQTADIRTVSGRATRFCQHDL
ncbi:hypothetical protein NB643_01905 [Oxalobacter aliiformigenes]|nr:hypothetical protein [Oxalobacter aliiformigenes]WAV95546.1 hypothetical protein NB643_01905 [Oxalobacter aliiformigenes]